MATAVLALAGAGLAACDEPFQFSLPAAAVRVSPDSATIRWGASLQLSATVTDSTGRPIAGYPVIWRSSNPAIADVSPRGLVTARDGGPATITALAGEASAFVPVTVHVPVASVTIAYPDPAVLVGAATPLVATPRDSLGRPLSGRALAWESGDTAVATVDSSGIVRGRMPGAATISVSSEGRGTTTVVRVETVVFTAIIAAKSDHSCALTDQGRAFCWGNDILGELGNGTAAGSATPVQVTGGLTFAALAGGGWFTCGLAAAGAAWCWGSGARGRLGTGALENQPAPEPVATQLVFEAVSTGWAHGCGLTAGETHCWGSGAAVGSGAGKYALSPMPLAGDPGFAQLAAGSEFSCGLTAAGAAWCWGLNYAGQLGDGTATAAAAPVPVAGGLAFTAITVGARHACGLTAAGAAWCWGDNSLGQLGTGLGESSATPELVTDGLTFAGLSAGGDFTCAWTVDGAAYCWGLDASGQLGDGAAAAERCGTFRCRTRPLVVSGGLVVRLVSAGGAHACALTVDGVADCWGANQSGQLGDGTVVARAVPVRVIGQP